MKALLPVLAGILLAGCSGAEPVAAPASPSPSPVATTPAPAPAVAPTCPADGSTDVWPAGVPADLPVPPTADVEGVTTNPDGLTLVRFSTRQSVRQGVVFLASALQPAGYTLGRGDAEAIEADVPFSKGEVRGLLKMIAQQECQTRWILALQSAPSGAPAASSAPLLPPVTTASPSPLPFG